MSNVLSATENLPLIRFFPPPDIKSALGAKGGAEYVPPHDLPSSKTDHPCSLPGSPRSPSRFSDFSASAQNHFLRWSPSCSRASRREHRVGHDDNDHLPPDPPGRDAQPGAVHEYQGCIGSFLTPFMSLKHTCRRDRDRGRQLWIPMPFPASACLTSPLRPLLYSTIPLILRSALETAPDDRLQMGVSSFPPGSCR